MKGSVAIPDALAQAKNAVWGRRFLSVCLSVALFLQSGHIVAAVSAGDIVATMTAFIIIVFDIIYGFAIPFVAVLSLTFVMWCEEHL
jgi:hypothetical protein